MEAERERFCTLVFIVGGKELNLSLPYYNSQIKFDERSPKTIRFAFLLTLE
jgi:hypothetical protein